MQASVTYSTDAAVVTAGATLLTKQVTGGAWVEALVGPITDDSLITVKSGEIQWLINDSATQPTEPFGNPLGQGLQWIFATVTTGLSVYIRASGSGSSQAADVVVNPGTAG